MKNCPSCLSKLEVNKKTLFLSYVSINCGVRSLDIEFLQCHVKAPDWNKYLTSKKAHEIRNHKKCSKPKCRIIVFNLDFDGDGKTEVELDVCHACNQVMFDLHEFDKVKEFETFSVDTGLPKPLKSEIEKIRTEGGEAVPRHLSFAVNASDFRIRSIFSSYKLHGWKFLLGFIGLPIESQNRIRNFPAVTYGLMAMISLVSLYTLFFVPSEIVNAGFLPADPFRHGGVTFITTFFLHADLGHLIGNMYTMYIFGDNIEDKLGKAQYLPLIFSGAMFGVFLHFLMTPEPNIPLVGASTGISSLITFLCAELSWHKVFCSHWFFNVDSCPCHGLRFVLGATTIRWSFCHNSRPLCCQFCKPCRRHSGWLRFLAALSKKEPTQRV